MSSAERWRVALLSRISRIFSRGSVTLRPALRKSLPSTHALRPLGTTERCRSRGVIRYDARAIILQTERHATPFCVFDTAPHPSDAYPRGPDRRCLRHDRALRLCVSHEYPAG